MKVLSSKSIVLQLAFMTHSLNANEINRLFEGKSRKAKQSKQPQNEFILFEGKSGKSKQTKKPSYNIYFGYLHAHTGVSDGSGTPREAYAQAKIAGLDFFGLSDHDYYPDYMTRNDWANITDAADSYNQDDIFTAFAGFEWSSDSDTYAGSSGYNLGHMTVVGSTGYCNSAESHCDTLDEFVNWLDSSGGLAILAHPGQYGSNIWSNFMFKKTPRIIGMELWNRNNNYYTRTGQDGIRYYDEALQKGWKIGAAGGQDNHDESWGTMNTARMAVLATELSREGIMEALAARRYYSTMIDDVEITFKCDEHEMGSSIFAAGEHSCTVDILSSHTFTWIDVVQNGSYSARVENPNFPYTISISTRGDEYVYVVLWQGNEWKIVTSPIFFEI